MGLPQIGTLSEVLEGVHQALARPEKECSGVPKGCADPPAVSGDPTPWAYPACTLG